MTSKVNPVELLVEAGTESQRANGVLPTPNEVQKYVQPIIEQMERREEENRHRITPAPPARKTGPQDVSAEMRREIEARSGSPLQGKWSVERRETKLVTPQKRRETVMAKRLRMRLRLLASIPEWSAKVRAVNPFALNGALGPEKQKQAEDYVRQVIKDSDAVFGPWIKPKAKKLIFT